MHRIALGRSQFGAGVINLLRVVSQLMLSQVVLLLECYYEITSFLVLTAYQDCNLV